MKTETAKAEAVQQCLDHYEQNSRGRVVWLFVCCILLLLLVVLALLVGASGLTPGQALAGLAGNGSATAVTIVRQIRLPRVLVALLAGGGLAVAGSVMQCILKNPLGSPFTLGVAQAAAFGSAFSIVMLPGNEFYTLTTAAFTSALLAALLLLGLVRYRGITPATMILTGVALGSLFTAGTTALQYFADDVELAAIVFWTFGDLSRATWTEIAIMVLTFFPLLGYFLYHSWDYSLLGAGENSALSLGVPVERLRVGGLLAAALLTSVIISFVGVIGFVGLVAPHISRLLLGTGERGVFLFSVPVGALLLLAADTAARTLFAPIVLPVGILTSFLGAPLFLYLVLRRRGYRWG